MVSGSVLEWAIHCAPPSSFWRYLIFRRSHVYQQAEMARNAKQFTMYSRLAMLNIYNLNICVHI